jgi:hypothetical protein
MKTLDRPTTRKSLPMSERDLRDLDLMRRSGVHRATLSRISHVLLTEGSSDATVLRAIWEAGIRAVAEQVEEAGYRQMADERDLAARRAAARRRRPAWADE